MASAGFAAAVATTGWALQRRTEKPRSEKASSDSALFEIEPTPAGSFLIRRRGEALGSQVSIVAIHDDVQVALPAIDDAFAAIERVEQVMSIYRPTSQLCRLNAERKLADADPWLVDVLGYAAATSAESQGAFDITVQPLWQLYADAQKQGQLPNDEQIAAAREAVDWRKVVVEGDSVSLTGSRTAVTLNGIAQGFAADRALEALRSAGVEHALIDTGELAPLGQSAKEKDWSAGIQHPRDPDSLMAVTKLAGRCLATSGDYATTFSQDRRYNHLFDPRTGKSPVGLASVSILAPTAMEADALSTACFVLGAERALALVEARDQVDALLVTTDGQTLKTAGFVVG